MATIGADYPTLADVARRLDPDGAVDAIAEILTSTNEILLDIPWVEGNLPTGHKSTVRTGLPTVTWRKLNYGVQPSKSRTAQVIDTCGMLEAYADVDKRIADLNGNTIQFRLSENKAFVEAMGQELASTIFYGDTDTDPEKFMGLHPRFNALSTDEEESGSHIISAGGDGDDNTSVWLVGWSPETVFGIYPKGSKAGLTHEDKGQVTLQDVDGHPFEGYRSHYVWDAGLVVRDWRYVVRIANIDVSALTKNAASGADLIDLMVQALELIESLTGVRPAFYCNRTIRSFLRRQLANKANVHLSAGEAWGKKALLFDEVPVRLVDKILKTEAAIA